jgi:hypothetical protein
LQEACCCWCPGHAVLRRCVSATLGGFELYLTRVPSDYNCNWLGGQVVADEIAAPGYDTAGFVNITTSDGIVHGQVRQSGLFSFVRVYESGHEVPFYQPLASLEIFERALGQVDIATGKEKACDTYKTNGTPTSDFREGNATVQMEVTPANATYNTALNAPDPVPTWAPSSKSVKRNLARQKDFRRFGRPVKSRGGKRFA